MIGWISRSWASTTCRKKASQPGEGQKSASSQSGSCPRSNARRQKTQPSTRSGWITVVSRIGK